MKKVRILLIAVFACLLAFCLVSCGEDKKETDGALDPVQTKGEEVTEETWRAAFSREAFENVTIKQIITFKGQTEKSELMLDAPNERFMSSSTYASEVIYANIDGKYYRFKDSERIEIDAQTFNEDMERFFKMFGYGLQQYADRYALFTYEEESGNYTYSEGVQIDITMRDGKCKRLAIKEQNEAVMEFTAYGTTTVTLPQVSDSDIAV